MKVGSKKKLFRNTPTVNSSNYVKIEIQKFIDRREIKEIIIFYARSVLWDYIVNLSALTRAN